MSGRSDSLDAVRGMAISLVVGYHYWPDVVASGDQIGVDLFFVLSGYLIGGILLDHRGYGGFFSTFYIRRAFRIHVLASGRTAFDWLCTRRLAVPRASCTGHHRSSGNKLRSRIEIGEGHSLRLRRRQLRFICPSKAIARP